MMITPVALVVFFAAHPGRFNDMVDWLSRFVP